jgi:23S rRNA (guanosine2251-2'-O)-methyltransferase
MRNRDNDPRKSRPKGGIARRDGRRGDDRPKHGRPGADDRPPRRDTTFKQDRPFKPERSNQERPRQEFKPDFKRDRPSRPDRTFKKKAWRAQARDPNGPVILYGWHSVKAALENPARRFHRLLATENALHRLSETGLTLPITPKLSRAEEIEALVGPDAVHQGILAEADPLASPDIDDLEAKGLVLVLDHITDPHNVGAILRSAAAFAVEAVIITSRHSPEQTGVLAKAASAALEHVPIVTVPNLARALGALQDKNVFVIGLDSSGESDLATVPLRAPLALVIGAEGKGLRQLTRTTCDVVARIALPGVIKSLNVSNATALALYVASERIKAIQ